MTTKFTPGPWSVEADMRSDLDNWGMERGKEYLTGWNVTSEDEEVVGCEGIIPGLTAEANARLIAAAPDLYEACDLAFDLMESLPHSVMPDQVELVRSALAKARGE